MIVYRELTSVPELEEVVDLEIAVWGIHPRDAVPADMMRPLVINGGVTIGAYENDRIVGMAMAYPARRGSKWLLWSHMAGVHPDYQSMGIGFGLKQAQRGWALRNGYKTMGWTYDPLRRGNAKFNIHRLGAVCSIYHENFYGVMAGQINAGLPSDRAEATWELQSRRVKTLSRGLRSFAPFVEPLFILYPDEQEMPCLDIPKLFPKVSAVQIPYDLDKLKQNKPDTALAWRIALRKVLQSAFAQGNQIVDFHDEPSSHQCWYILQAAQPWYLYVVKCADDTLYTGITPDLSNRVKAHNAGRGAVYTSARRPVTLMGAWSFAGRSEALRAERAFKKLTRQQKLGLIETRADFLDMPYNSTH